MNDSLVYEGLRSLSPGASNLESRERFPGKVGRTVSKAVSRGSEDCSRSFYYCRQEVERSTFPRRRFVGQKRKWEWRGMREVSP